MGSASSLLSSRHAESIEFSPLEDSALPGGLDVLSFGGGYPELYAGNLSIRREMLAAVEKFADEGGTIYAECGGLMYLADKIVTHERRGAAAIKGAGGDLVRPGSHGRHSVLYGADALGSVIQITTRRGSTPLPEFTYSVDGGNFGSLRQEVS